VFALSTMQLCKINILTLLSHIEKPQKVKQENIKSEEEVMIKEETPKVN
jgi:hypothetical protein